MKAKSRMLVPPQRRHKKKKPLRRVVPKDAAFHAPLPESSRFAPDDYPEIDEESAQEE